MLFPPFKHARMNLSLGAYQHFDNFGINSFRVRELRSEEPRLIPYRSTYSPSPWELLIIAGLGDGFTSCTKRILLF